MYEEDTCYYDTTQEVKSGDQPVSNYGGLEDNLKLSSSYTLEHLSNHHNHNPSTTTEAAAVALDLELEHELNSHLMQDVLHLHDPNTNHHQNWENTRQLQAEMQDVSSQQYHRVHEQIDNLQCFNNSSSSSSYAPFGPQTPTPDLLNLFHLPRCSILPNSSISFANPNKKPCHNFPDINILGNDRPNVLYDHSTLHLDLPPQETPIFKDLFHSLPHNYGGSSRLGATSSFFGGMGMDDRDVGIYQDGDGNNNNNSMLNFSTGLGKPEGKGPRQHFATERQRREQLNGKYEDLRSLVPNPNKGDRASVVHGAIEYIRELIRTVDELKILVDKKRYGRQRCKKLKTENEEEAAGDMESSSMKPLDQSNGTSRGTWLKRKSKETEVDVRIIEDEVTIKLIQRNKLNCLLSVSKILDELQLDLLHVSGGNIGNSNCFLFNTKIYEGSSVHACAIANKLIEAVDKNYAAFEPGSF